MYYYKSKIKKSISLIISIFVAVTCLMTVQSATARANTAEAPASYSITSYSGADINGEKDLNQHVVLKLTFHQIVSISDEKALNNSIFGQSPGFRITIAGYNISSASYYRPCTYSADGKDLTIDIGNCISNGTPVFTAIYAGSFVAGGKLSGLALNGTATDVNVDIPETKIVTGVALENVNSSSGTPSWDTNALTMKVSHVANIRCMFHFVVYKVTDSSSDPVKVVPVTCSTGEMGSYSASGHAHVYYQMYPSDFASWMASSLSTVLIGGYTAKANGDTVTITSDNPKDKLRMYMFDDDYLQSGEKCQIQTPDPKVSFSKDNKDKVSGTLHSNNGDSYTSYTLNANGDSDGMASWAANINTVTVDGIKYYLTTTAPYRYNQGTKNYFYLYRSGGYFKINIASGAINCSSDITTHNITIGNDLFDSLSQSITINNVKVDKAALKSLKNKKKKKLVIKIKAVAGAKGYVVSYSKKSNMKAAKTISVSKTSVTVSKLTKGKKYYVRVRAFKYDSTGQKIYGSWSKIKNIKIKK